MAPDVKLGEIMRTTSRLPFSKGETELMAEVLKRGRAKGRDYYFGTVAEPFRAADIESSLNDGLAVIASPSQLRQDFLFVKCDGGRSIFGSQKAVFKSFIGEASLDEWTVGTTFSKWVLAITGIGNVYRGSGLR